MPTPPPQPPTLPEFPPGDNQVLQNSAFEERLAAHLQKSVDKLELEKYVRKHLSGEAQATGESFLSKFTQGDMDAFIGRVILAAVDYHSLHNTSPVAAPGEARTRFIDLYTLASTAFGWLEENGKDTAAYQQLQRAKAQNSRDFLEAFRAIAGAQTADIIAKELGKVTGATRPDRFEAAGQTTPAESVSDDTKYGDEARNLVASTNMASRMAEIADEIAQARRTIARSAHTALQSGGNTVLNNIVDSLTHVVVALNERAVQIGQEHGTLEPNTEQIYINTVAEVNRATTALVATISDG